MEGEQISVEGLVAEADVKVYTDTSSFFKDGYTDIRGVFDYASLTNDKLQSVKRFAILVMSEEKGAYITEANPPPW